MKKLQPMKAMGHALQSTFSNLGFAFHISWPWMLVIFPLNVAAALYKTWNGLASKGAFDADGSSWDFIVAIASLIAFASIAVSWHRYMLKDEVPQGMARLRLDNVVWRYVGNSILMFLIFFAIGLPIGFLGWAIGSTIGIAGLISYGAVFFLVALSASYRLSIRLPSIAMERTDIRFGDAWRMTAGNFWQFMGLGLMFIAILLGVGLAVGSITYGVGLTGNTLLLVMIIVIQQAMNWVATILGVTLLTSLYGFFVEGREF